VHEDLYQAGKKEISCYYIIHILKHLVKGKYYVEKSTFMCVLPDV